MELLPSQAYGNGWLEVTHNGRTLKALPQQGDPYEEIYKLRGKWYGLLREEWINPARQELAGYERTLVYLNGAKSFHNAIASTYHDQSYAHYGADSGHAAWHHVIWAIGDSASKVDFELLQVAADDRQGTLHLVDPSSPCRAEKAQVGIKVTMQAANAPGDQTVPLHSAEHQLRSGKFKGIFRQTGYEHQDSYKHEFALHSTLYSLVRIAHTMEWTT